LVACHAGIEANLTGCRAVHACGIARKSRSVLEKYSGLFFHHGVKRISQA
jgi:hypothetical protein